MNRFAKSRPRPVPGQMNKTEQAYAAALSERKLAGLIRDWAFEPIKLRLADRTFYTPDFMIHHNDGLIEFCETKGFWEDDARVKIKVAAEVHYWAKFTAVKVIAKKHGGGWETKEF